MEADAQTPQELLARSFFIDIGPFGQTPFVSLDDIAMVEVEPLSPPEPLDGNPLKPSEVPSVSIWMCEDAGPEYNQQGVETSRKDVFS